MKFTDAQISKWASDYEQEITAKHNLVAARISLNVISGSSEYNLPDNLTNIRSVLFQGKELHPKGFRASVITGDTPFQTAGSVPFEYVFSGHGLRVIKFYPTPNIDIPIYTGDLWTADADQAAVIVEYFQTGTLPEWLRRYILKDYVCWKAFVSEGPQQDLRAANYYQMRMGEQEGYIGQIKDNMTKVYHRILLETKMAGRRKPGRPVLPPTFGIPVNWS